MRIAIVCCSLNPDSRSSGMAEHLRRPLAEAGVEVDWLDLREHNLPLCNGSTVYGNPTVREVHRRIEAADAAIMVLPIYNYDGNAAAKNLIELTGRAWQHKTVGFVCSAGGRASYMSIMSLANSLMLDFRCVIVPRFVYADDSDFTGDGIDPVVVERLEGLARKTAQMAEALSGLPTLS